MAMKSIFSGFRNKVYAGLAALALAGSVSGTGCNDSTGPKKTSYLPVTCAELSVSPQLGINPLDVKVKESCTGDIASYKVMMDGNMLTTANPTDTTITLNQTANFSMESIGKGEDTVTKGPVTATVLQPSISLTANLVNYVDIKRTVNLVNVDSAKLELFRDGNLVSSRTVSRPAYSDSLANNTKGQYSSVLTAFGRPTINPDTSSLAVPDYPAAVYLGKIQNLYTDDSIIVSIDSVKDRNPEDNPVTVTGVTDLDSIVSAGLITGRNQIKINSRDSVASYSIGINTRTATGIANTFVFNGKINPDEIAFSSIIPGINGQPPAEGDEIYTVNINNTSLEKLTSIFQNIMPNWCPNGRIVFQSNRDSIFSSYIMNQDGSNQTRIVSTPLRVMSPSCSPDGKYAVFIYTDFLTKSGIGRSRIDSLGNAIDSTFTSLYEEQFYGGTPYYPRFSPDGTKIAFETSNGKIGVMNAADGSNRRTLFLNDPYSYDDAVWIPNSSGLYLISNRDNGRNVYKTDLQGDIGPLIPNTNGAADIDISPNGKKIVYSEMGSSQFYIVNSDGSGSVQTITVPGLARFPAFRPRIR